MRKKWHGPTPQGKIAVVVIIIMFCLMAYIEARPAGQPCNFAADCGLNEKCKYLELYERSDQNYTGMCVPEEW